MAWSVSETETQTWVQVDSELAAIDQCHLLAFESDKKAKPLLYLGSIDKHGFYFDQGARKGENGPANTSQSSPFSQHKFHEKRTGYVNSKEEAATGGSRTSRISGPIEATEEELAQIELTDEAVKERKRAATRQMVDGILAIYLDAGEEEDLDEQDSSGSGDDDNNGNEGPSQRDGAQEIG